MLRYHGNEEEGGDFCYLLCVKTERRFLLPVLLEGFPRVTVLSRIPGWAKGSLFIRWQGGLPSCRLPQVCGEWLWVFIWPDNVPLSLYRDSWHMMQLISVCSSVLARVGRWAQPREEEEKD